MSLEVMKQAREAGLQWTPAYRLELERFAALVAAAEREACARVCDERELANLYGVKECATAIRARGKD